MGVDLVTAKFLAYCKTLEVDFSATATLGRQTLYAEKRDVAHLFSRFQIACDDQALEEMFRHNPTAEYAFADGFFRALGATSVDAIDASDYEGASIVHDMNKRLPAAQESHFSAVLDGGTLEHVFNFPVAIENCMKLLRPGGHFISVAPANNYFGHGFYQFSSELFFRVFSQANGFRVLGAFLCAEKPFGPWFEIPDPESIRERVALKNQVPTLQLFVARKISHDACLHMLPQQSDYSQILWKRTAGENWTAHGDARMNQRAAIFRRALGYLPRSAAQFLRASRPVVTGAFTPPFNHRKLRRFDPLDPAGRTQRRLI